MDMNKIKNNMIVRIKANSVKCVKFGNRVAVFKINDSGKPQAQEYPLKTEEEQAKRILKYRNY